MAIGADGHWVAGIGDPSAVGWLTVVIYAGAAAMAWRNAAFARRTRVPSSFWWALAVMLLALGLNKQLDLQTWFGETGRQMALDQGWYEQRRWVQGGFIAALAAGCAVCIAAARRVWAALWHEYWPAFVGVALLLFFIVIRAASFHHVDAVIGVTIGGTKLGRGIELLGVLVIAGACGWWYRMHRRRVLKVAFGRPVAQRKKGA